MTKTTTKSRRWIGLLTLGLSVLIRRRRKVQRSGPRAVGSRCGRWRSVVLARNRRACLRGPRLRRATAVQALIYRRSERPMAATAQELSELHHFFLPGGPPSSVIEALHRTTVDTRERLTSAALHVFGPPRCTEVGAARLDGDLATWFMSIPRAEAPGRPPRMHWFQNTLAILRTMETDRPCPGTGNARTSSPQNDARTPEPHKQQ